MTKHAPAATCCRFNRYCQRSVPVVATSGRMIERSVVGRYLSSGTKDADLSTSECARYLSELSHGDLTGALARHLSPSARREIAEARERVLAEKGSAETPSEDAGATETADNAAEEAPPEPTRRDLRLIMLNQSIPFVGFGIMDNAILILAGDAIDTTLGVTLGISTLCAAAIGNIISDLAGVGLGTVIEDFCSKLNIPQPNLTQAQRQLRSVRFAGQFGCAFGITVGCIIGMFPLLFIDSKKGERMKEEAHLEDMFNDMVTEAKGLIGAEHTVLYTMVDSEEETKPPSHVERDEAGASGKYLYGTFTSDDSNKVKHAHVPVGRGILSRAVMNRTSININDAKTNPDFHYDNDILGPIPRENVGAMLCVPVFDSHGNVIAVIKAINKIAKGSASPSDDWKGGGFTTNDVKVLHALATHVSVSLENLYDEEDKVSLRDTIHILREHGASPLLEDDTS